LSERVTVNTTAFPSRQETIELFCELGRSPIDPENPYLIQRPAQWMDQVLPGDIPLATGSTDMAAGKSSIERSVA
jgi:hypothetical protein